MVAKVSAIALIYAGRRPRSASVAVSKIAGPCHAKRETNAASVRQSYEPAIDTLTVRDDILCLVVGGIGVFGGCRSGRMKEGVACGASRKFIRNACREAVLLYVTVVK